MIRVAIVDDHPVVVNGIASILNNQEEIELCGAFTQAHELFKLLETAVIDIAIIDINMPGINGFDTIAHLKANYPNTKILTLTMLNDGPTLRRIIDKGADGYLEKNADQRQILEALNELHKKGNYLQEKTREKLVRSNKIENDRANIHTTLSLPDISKREKDVIKCILSKMKNEKIAETLFISENTVRSHKKNIFRKFDVGNTSELIIEIHRQGLAF